MPEGGYIQNRFMYWTSIKNRAKATLNCKRLNIPPRTNLLEGNIGLKTKPRFLKKDRGFLLTHRLEVFYTVMKNTIHKESNRSKQRAY